MLPHKTPRGAAALKRLKVFEGMPTPYDKLKRQVVPDALRVNRLKPGRRFTVLGQLSSSVGWSFGPVVAKLEVSLPASFYNGHHHPSTVYNDRSDLFIGQKKGQVRCFLPEKEGPGRSEKEGPGQRGSQGHQRCSCQVRSLSSPYNENPWNIELELSIVFYFSIFSLNLFSSLRLFFCFVD